MVVLRDNFLHPPDVIAPVKKFGVFESKWVKKLFYNIPIAIVPTGVKYDTFVISFDEDLWILFHYRRSFPEIRIHELYAKLDVGVNSSGASAPNPQSTVIGGGFSSMAAGFVPFENRSVRQQTFEVASGPSIIELGKPDRVENAMREDDSDQELVDIIGDSDDDTGANPRTQHDPSSSDTQQYPPHFSTLNLEAMRQQPDENAVVGSFFTEFQIGHSFQNKEEAILSVKDYSIRRGVEYMVLESNRLKYHGKCKEFGKGCSWLIRISLRAQKVTWEVRRYNGSHTCLTTSISSDHRQLNYHIICARIYPLVRADAAIMIKVL
ncbi:uncharacterized protein LOC130965868 [Arachis stenosperma]|uniref:uncharacterized protein LOC130965868 n=1 Tax=Arachis stenosperma TaxID=217475 RepID=UPI0025ABDC07|nr:uncharacterized protein LOC130965868 [Arachis stenosperma]